MELQKISTQELARISGVPDGRIRKLVESPRAIPNALAWKLLIALEGVHEVRRQAAELPECSWLRERKQAVPLHEWDEERILEWATHAESCDACSAAMKWDLAHPSPMETFPPFAQRPWDKLLFWLPTVALVGFAALGLWLGDNGGPSFSVFMGLGVGLGAAFLLRKAEGWGLLG